MINSQTRKPRPIGQKIALGIAFLSYGAAIASAIGAVLYETQGEQDPIHASLMATVVFFISCGIVLQVIGTARLHGVLSGSGELDRD